MIRILCLCQWGCLISTVICRRSSWYSHAWQSLSCCSSYSWCWDSTWSPADICSPCLLLHLSNYFSHSSSTPTGTTGSIKCLVQIITIYFQCIVQPCTILIVDIHFHIGLVNNSQSFWNQLILKKLSLLTTQLPFPAIGDCFRNIKIF